MAVTIAGSEMAVFFAICQSSIYLSLFASSCMYVSALLKNVTEIFGKIDRIVKETVDDELGVRLHYVDLLQLHSKTLL